MKLLSGFGHRLTMKEQETGLKKCAISSFCCDHDEMLRRFTKIAFFLKIIFKVKTELALGHQTTLRSFLRCSKALVLQWYEEVAVASTLIPCQKCFAHYRQTQWFAPESYPFRWLFCTIGYATSSYDFRSKVSRSSFPGASRSSTALIVAATMKYTRLIDLIDIGLLVKDSSSYRTSWGFFGISDPFRGLLHI